MKIEIGEKIFKFIKRPFIRFFDWYILSYHAKDYIHKDRIKDEMKKAIDSTKERVNKKRDEELEKTVNLLNENHKIEIDRFLAEMDDYKDDAKRVGKLQKKLTDFYYTLEKRAQAISIVAGKNKHEGTKIMNTAGAFIGSLDEIEENMLNITKEFKDNANKEQQYLVE